MTRLLTSILLLFTQVFVVFSTGNLVLCVHDDGECAIELVGSECCRAAHAAERQQPDHNNDAHGALSAPLADRCTDIPYKQEQTTVAHGPQLRSALNQDLRTAPPTIVAWTNPAIAVAVSVAHVSVRGPPRDAVPRPPRAFILRC